MSPQHTKKYKLEHPYIPDGYPNWTKFDWEIIDTKPQDIDTRYIPESTSSLDDDYEMLVYYAFKTLSLKEKLIIYAYLRYGKEFEGTVRKGVKDIVTKYEIHKTVSKFKKLCLDNINN